MDGQQKEPPDQGKETAKATEAPFFPADSQQTETLTLPTVAETAASATATVPLAGSQNVSAGKLVLRPGAVFGKRYEILHQLGEGGMGAVYKATDRELDRVVALKVIRPELANQPEVRRRFKQELILARQVTHKNVIRIFDLGEAEGIKFITMEFVDGRDL